MWVSRSWLLVSIFLAPSSLSSFFSSHSPSILSCKSCHTHIQDLSLSLEKSWSLANDCQHSRSLGQKQGRGMCRPWTRLRIIWWKILCSSYLLGTCRNRGQGLNLWFPLASKYLIIWGSILLERGKNMAPRIVETGQDSQGRYWAPLSYFMNCASYYTTIETII